MRPARIKLVNEIGPDGPGGIGIMSPALVPPGMTMACQYSTENGIEMRVYILGTDKYFVSSMTIEEIDKELTDAMYENSTAHELNLNGASMNRALNWEPPEKGE